MRLTYSHKHTENASTCGTVSTEGLLNADKRPQDSDRARKTSQNWVGQKKEDRKNKKGSETRPAPLGGSWKEENLPGRTLTTQEMSWDRGGALGHWRGTQQWV